MITLPDVSFWQDDPHTPNGIDFRQMATQTPAVIIRAGQGSYPDREFLRNWKAAKEAGLRRGAYWFYDSRVSPKRQAAIFSGLLRADPPELEAYFDAEENYKGEWAGWRRWYDFIEEFRRLTPAIEVGVYTGYYYWRENTWGMTRAQLDYFKQFPLWIAAYDSIAPLVPAPWRDWLMWQFTDDASGDEYGVESREIDLNYRKGDLQPVPTPTPYLITANYLNKQAKYVEAV